MHRGQEWSKFDRNMAAGTDEFIHVALSTFSSRQELCTFKAGAHLYYFGASHGLIDLATRPDMGWLAFPIGQHVIASVRS